jgi:hypothetical protein
VPAGTVRVFKSDITVMGRLLAKYAVAGAILILAATAIGQWRADRFPSFGDLGLSVLIAPAACAALGLLFYLASLAFPVKVLTNGLRCYDAFGRYHTISWADVTGVGFMSMYGLKYVAIQASTITQPITVPLFLSDMAEFRRLVEAQAGPDHIVVRALHATATAP